MVSLNPGGYYTLRFRFRKIGNLQFVSHLDLVRTFSKIAVRTKLPLWFTEGFNPKPKLVFSAPLSIGVESETEFLDIRLTEYVEPKEALEMMNRNVTDEMRFFDAYYPETKLSDIAYLSYEIRIKTDGVCDALADKCRETLLEDEVLTEKKGKDGNIKTVNIRSGIHAVTVKAEGELLVISSVLCADSSSFLNPDLLIRVLKEKCAVLAKDDPQTEYFSVKRLCAFDKDMKEFR